MHDTETPPGQIVNREQPKYLRDVIKKYYDEEPQEARKSIVATLPSPDAEKRLERLKTALLSLCDGLELNAKGEWRVPSVSTTKIREILKDV